MTSRWSGRNLSYCNNVLEGCNLLHLQKQTMIAAFCPKTHPVSCQSWPGSECCHLLDNIFITTKANRRWWFQSWCWFDGYDKPSWSDPVIVPLRLRWSTAQVTTVFGLLGKCWREAHNVMAMCQNPERADMEKNRAVSECFDFLFTHSLNLSESFCLTQLMPDIVSDGLKRLICSNLWLLGCKEAIMSCFLSLFFS